MRSVVQRVEDCRVSVDGKVVGAIDRGLLVYLGVAHFDAEADADYLADKVAHLRVFVDGEGRMNRSVLEEGGGVLVVSQFTLFGDARRGRRPSYDAAASPEKARALYEYFVRRIMLFGIPAQAGVFGASMRVEYTNQGPVTLLLDSGKLF